MNRMNRRQAGTAGGQSETAGAVNARADRHVSSKCAATPDQLNWYVIMCSRRPLLQTARTEQVLGRSPGGQAGTVQPAPPCSGSESMSGKQEASRHAPCVQEVGQGQQAQRVPGRRRVENDAVEAAVLRVLQARAAQGCGLAGRCLASASQPTQSSDSGRGQAREAVQDYCCHQRSRSDLGRFLPVIQLLCPTKQQMKRTDRLPSKTCLEELNDLGNGYRLVDAWRRRVQQLACRENDNDGKGAQNCLTTGLCQAVAQLQGAGNVALRAAPYACMQPCPAPSPSRRSFSWSATPPSPTELRMSSMRRPSSCPLSSLSSWRACSTTTTACSKRWHVEVPGNHRACTEPQLPIFCCPKSVVAGSRCLHISFQAPTQPPAHLLLSWK